MNDRLLGQILVYGGEGSVVQLALPTIWIARVLEPDGLCGLLGLEQVREFQQ